MANKRPWGMHWRIWPQQWVITSAKNIFLFVVVPMLVLGGFWPWLFGLALALTFLLLVWVWVKG